MSRLFNRSSRVTVASNLISTSTSAATGEFFNVFSRETTIEQMRVMFEIEKTLTADPNTCKLTINNLSERTRSEFQNRPLHVTLDVGYAGVLKQVFKGDLIWGDSIKQGTEWLTELQLGTGHRAIRHARVSRSYKAGGNLKQLLSDTARSMGLKLPTNAAEAKGLIHQFVGGVVLQGPSPREMTRLLKPRGFGWSVQDDRLQILQNAGVRVVEALVISAATGMVGSPELGAPTDRGKPPVLTVKTLIEPDLEPGNPIRVISERITGNFKILKVKHSGDTHGTSWYSEVEATQL